MEEIRALGESSSRSRALLIVPDPLKLDTEGFLMQATGKDALMMAEVLSFRRLAERLMGEVGGLAARYADASGRSMAIHRVLKANRKDLRVFGPMADRPGFVPRIEAVLSEFRRYGIRPEDLERTLSDAPDDLSPASFRNKTRDLALILKDYEETLDRLGLLDPGCNLDRLAGILKNVTADAGWPFDRIAWLKDASVWIDGFGERRDFTPQESQVIEALTSVCREVTVTLCTDSVPADRLSAEDGPDALAIGRRTAFHLNRRLAPWISPGGIVSLGTSGRGRHPELIHLRRCLEKGLQETFDGPAEAVVRLCAVDAYEETAWVAGEIRRLVFREGFRFRDIAVAACSFDAYAPLLEAAFDEYGIAGFMDREVKLSGSALPRFVLSFLAIGSASWSLESVMACLRTGLTDLAPDEADRLENFFLSRGITGKGRIFDDRRYADDFASDPAGLGPPENAEDAVDVDKDPRSASAGALSVLALRDRSLRPLRKAIEEVMAEETCAGRCTALAAFLDRYGMPDRVFRLARSLRGKGASDGAMRLVKSWNALCSVLRQMEAVAGEETIALDDFAALLSAGIDACRAGTIPASPDAVLAGPPDRVIDRRPAVLFVLGASADALPMKGVTEGLLNAADRDRLAQAGGLDLPSGIADKPFEDAFREYSLLSVPTERLYVGYAATDRKGAAVEPSSTFVRVKALLPGCRDVEAGPTRKAATATRFLGLGATGARIPAALIDAAFGPSRQMSVSQLKLRRRDVWKPELADAGSLAHGVVELAMTELQQGLDRAASEGRDPADVLREFLDSDLERKVDSLVRATARRDALGIFLDEGFQASAGRKVRKTAAISLRAAVEQIGTADFLPSCHEWAFGTESANPLTIELADGGQVLFRGRVDRIDSWRKDGEERFRVVDYKSGDKKVDYDALYEGLAFQLPAYLAAFRDAGRAGEGGGPNTALEALPRVPYDAAYFHLGVPVFSAACASRVPTPDDRARSERRYFALRGLDLPPEKLDLTVAWAKKRMRSACEGLFAGRFDVRPTRTVTSSSPCNWCDYRGVCRLEGKGDGLPVPTLAEVGAGKKRPKRVIFVEALERGLERQVPT